MRDPERIERIGVKLVQVWKKYPDWRLGQVVSNLCGGMSGGSKGDIFFPEDDDWEKWIDVALGIPHENKPVFTGKNEFFRFVRDLEKSLSARSKAGSIGSAPPIPGTGKHVQPAPARKRAGPKREK